MDNDQLVLTVEEAAKMLRVSRAFAYELVARGDLPHLRLGRRIVIPHAALKRMIEHGKEDLATST